MLLRFTGLYAKEMEIETINFGCNNTEAASKLNTVLNTIGPNFDLLTLWRNGILLPKLFWPNVRNCSSDQKKRFEIQGWRPRICKIFEITGTISHIRSEQFLVTECFFNLFLEVFSGDLETFRKSKNFFFCIAII